MAATAPKSPAKPRAKRPTSTSSGNGTAPRTPDVRVVARSKLIVRDGFNPRTLIEEQELDQLAASISERGILQPLMVREAEGGKFYVLGGHRRLAAGDKVGLTEYPVTVRDSADADELVDAVVDNKHRVDLTPLDEALAFGRLRDGGLTVAGIAKQCSVAQRLVTERLRILELPVEIQECFGDGRLPTSVVKDLAAMTAASPTLALAVVQAALKDPSDHWSGIRALVKDPFDAAWHVADRLPKQLIRVRAHSQAGGGWRRHGYSSGGIDTRHLAPLPPEMASKVNAMNSGAKTDWDRYTIHVDQAVVDQLAAARVLYLEPDRKKSGICVDRKSLLAVVEPIIEADHKAYLKDAAERRRRAAQGPAGQSAQEKADERARERQLRVDARAFNLQLGEALTKHLSAPEFSVDVVKLLCLRLIDDHDADLAARGLRYVLPQWQLEIQPKTAGAQVKVKYPTKKSGSSAPDVGEGSEHHPSECNLPSLFWAWWNLATTPQEIVGRTLIALAAARYADERAVAQSDKAYWQPFGWSNDSGPGKLLDELLKGKLPPRPPSLRNDPHYGRAHAYPDVA